MSRYLSELDEYHQNNLYLFKFFQKHFLKHVTSDELEKKKPVAALVLAS
jgi:hypothetical protein